MKTIILIYKISNKINEKVYIGQTIQTLPRRFAKHTWKSSRCLKIKNAINKYGKNNFCMECLTICHIQEIANYWESYFIKKYDSIENGYNIREGGSHGQHSEETKRKLLAFATSEENRRKISERQKGNKYGVGNKSNTGKKLSKEHKQNISKAKKGKPPNTAKLTQKIADEIRQDFHSLYTVGPKSNIQKQLATKYGISWTMINRIVNNKIWTRSLSPLIPAPPSTYPHLAAKITQEIANKIREEYTAGKGKVLQRELGEKYGIGVGAVSDIIRNRNWKVK